MSGRGRQKKGGKGKIFTGGGSSNKDTISMETSVVNRLASFGLQQSVTYKKEKKERKREMSQMKNKRTKCQLRFIKHLSTQK